MNRNIFLGFIALVFMVVSLCSCEGEGSIGLQGNNGTSGELEFSWSQKQSGDTLILYCNQTLRYKENSGWKEIHPVGEVKLYPTLKLVEYESGNNPKPIHINTSKSSGYEGTNPRYQVIYQKFYFNDDQIYIAEIRYPLYSYNYNGRSLYYPHVELQYLLFMESSIRTAGSKTYANIDFDLVWETSNKDQSGTQRLSVSYEKTEVKQKDKLLDSETKSGLEWVGAEQFYLYVKKTEVWSSGTKVYKKTSPVLDFPFTSSNQRSIEVSNFDFNGSLSSNVGAKQDVGNSEWRIKKSMTTQTIMFSNQKEYFEDVFTYPFYEASLDWDGERFSFDLSIDFKENWQIAIINSSSAKNTTVATVVFGGKTFRKSVITSMNKKSDPDPDPNSRYGKVLGYAVSAVFDQAALTQGGAITKKCVLVHFEKGYYWGICAYDKAFPTEFTFTTSDFGSFDSAAKKNASSAFQLARAVETTANIIWYDENNRQISGIDALTCKIYGWANVVDGHYASAVSGYSILSKTDYSLVLKAPDGSTKTF